MYIHKHEHMHAHTHAHAHAHTHTHTHTPDRHTYIHKQFALIEDCEKRVLSWSSSKSTWIFHNFKLFMIFISFATFKTCNFYSDIQWETLRSSPFKTAKEWTSATDAGREFQVGIIRAKKTWIWSIFPHASSTYHGFQCALIDVSF